MTNPSVLLLWPLNYVLLPVMCWMWRTKENAQRQLQMQQQAPHEMLPLLHVFESLLEEVVKPVCLLLVTLFWVYQWVLSKFSRVLLISMPLLFLLLLVYHMAKSRSKSWWFMGGIIFQNWWTKQLDITTYSLPPGELELLCLRQYRQIYLKVLEKELELILYRTVEYRLQATVF